MSRLGRSLLILLLAVGASLAKAEAPFALGVIDPQECVQGIE